MARQLTLAAMEPRVPANVLGLRAAAEYLGMSECSLRRLVDARAIRYQQKVPRGRIRFKVAWLDAYLEEASTAPKERNSKPPNGASHGLDYSRFD
jgi:hypothetical protein